MGCGVTIKDRNSKSHYFNREDVECFRSEISTSDSRRMYSAGMVVDENDLTKTKKTGNFGVFCQGNGVITDLAGYSYQKKIYA